MHAVHQLIEHFRSTEAMTADLRGRLVQLGLLQDDFEGDEFQEYCDDCYEWSIPLGTSGRTWIRGQFRFADLDEDALDNRWLTQDHGRRSKVSRRLRGKRGRRWEATVNDVRKALATQLDKWLLPGGRLDRLVEVGSLLTPCGTWRKATRVLTSYPVSRLVEELNRRTRHTVRPLFNRLDDFDLALRSFARPWRGQAGAALRRLVTGRADKRSRKLLKYQEFLDSANLIDLASHLTQARRHCVRQARQRQRSTRQAASTV